MEEELQEVNHCSSSSQVLLPEAMVTKCRPPLALTGDLLSVLQTPPPLGAAVSTSHHQLIQWPGQSQLEVLLRLEGN